MKLAELYAKPLCEVLKGMEMADVKIHTDDSGCVKGIEIKYVPNESNNENKLRPKRETDFEF